MTNLLRESWIRWNMTLGLLLRYTFQHKFNTATNFYLPNLPDFWCFMDFTNILTSLTLRAAVTLVTYFKVPDVSVWCLMSPHLMSHVAASPLSLRCLSVWMGLCNSFDIAAVGSQRGTRSNCRNERDSLGLLAIDDDTWHWATKCLFIEGSLKLPPKSSWHASDIPIFPDCVFPRYNYPDSSGVPYIRVRLYLVTSRDLSTGICQFWC